jgi:hypothetical protein
VSQHPGWVGVDLDGTLVEYDRWRGPAHLGAPVPKMMERVRKWLAIGAEVRIFTARISVQRPPAHGFDEDGYQQRLTDASRARSAINEFCMEHFGTILPITCEKDFACIQIWDDRAIQVIPNTGERADGGT